MCVREGKKWGIWGAENKKEKFGAQKGKKMDNFGFRRAKPDNFGFIRAENGDFLVQKGQNGGFGPPPPVSMVPSLRPERLFRKSPEVIPARRKEVTSTRGCGGRK